MTRDGDRLTRRKVLVLSAGAITATAIACARPDAAAADERTRSMACPDSAT